MPRPAFSEASPSATRRGRQRLAVLAAGAVMVVGALTAIAVPAAATPAASATGSHLTAQDCGGTWVGSGNRTCVASAATTPRATSASMQDCGGGSMGSGGVTSCVESAATSARMPDPPMPCGPLSTYCPAPEPDLALTTSAFAQNCGGGWAGSGNRTCVESAATPAHATIAA